MPSLIAGLLLSFAVVASAVSAGYFATSYVSKKTGAVASTGKSKTVVETRKANPATAFLSQDAVVPATVKTDKSDYQPGEYVNVSGTGWLPGETVNLVFHERLDDPFHEDATLTAIADSEGNFSNGQYQLEEHDRGVSYVVKATGTQSGSFAQVYFTDAADASLDQCANGSLTSPDATPCQGGDAGDEGWVNGNLGENKSHYAEGDSISYRMMFSGLAVGTHVVTIEWDTTKGDKHALDYLTTYNRSVDSNPCEGVTGCNQNVFNPFAIPADPQVTGAGVTPVAGEFRLFGGTITNVSAYSYADGAGFAGDKSAQITLTFTATVDNPVLAWGGHIATRPDWGLNNSAVSISGSPYHTRLIDLDGSGGNQDRSLSAEAVVFPASVTIIKDTVPNGPRDFNFSATGGLSPSSFTLDDDSDPTNSNTRAFSDILVTANTGNDYTVTETPVFGWNLSFNNPICTVTSANGGSQSATTNGVNINLREGENVTCTFINTEDTTKTRGNIKVVKQTLPDGSSQSFQFTANYDVNGFSLTDGGSNTSAQLTPSAEGGGPYTVSEGAVAGWTSDGGVCDNGTPNNITVVAGQTTTCTFTNTQTPKLTVIKHVIKDNGGTAVAGDFTMNVTATNPSSSSFPGAESPGTTITLDAGSYSVGESGPSGYSASSSADCSGTIAPGNNKTCTITNNDQTAHLKLVKTVTNDNGGRAVAANWTLSANGPTPISGAGGVESDVNAGTYTLSESAGPSGYAAGNFYCTNGVTVNAGQITLALNQSTVCTINNNDIAPKLHLRKIVVNNNGGAATVANFTLTANGTGANDLSGTSPVDSGASLKADTWALSETNVYGYSASAWSCVGGTQYGSNITLGVGGEATCTITNDDQPGTIIIEKLIKPAGSLTSFSFQTTGTGYNPFSLSGGQSSTQSLNAGNYTSKELVPLGWVLTGIGGSSDPNTPYNCIVTGSGGSTGVGDLNTQTVSITLKIGDTVKCIFENTGQGVTRTQGFWATHPQLANIAWFGGTAFGHTFPGVASVSGIGDTTLCNPVKKDVNTLGRLMGGFWSDISKTTTGGKRSALDQGRMQLLQQLLAAELNASAFGSVPSSGSFAAWETAYCGGSQNDIKNAQQQAASFNTNGDSGQFTPGTSADSKTARTIADLVFWNILP